MTTPAQLQIAELDYDQILQNLIAFMKADPSFSDYDFSGSGLNLIARVLAYVTFYNNAYLSAAANEAFLDTAQLRSSVVSHARMLGYQATGMRSATYTANVSVVMTSNALASVTLPQNTKFELQSNTSYTFYTTDDATMTQTANDVVYTVTGVTLVEGRPATYQFTVDVNNPTQRFVIPTANVDFAHLTVDVRDSSASNTTTRFLEVADTISVSNTDPIFIVHETYSGFPELQFGNGVVGKALEHGNIVTVQYYVSRGADGNNIRGPFRINDTTIDGLVRGVTATPDSDTTPSNGGSNGEDIEQIRYLAPLVYSTQNRCVTEDDYKALILAEYGDAISSINVFGGEQGDPYDPTERPALGRVYIAIKPVNGTRLPDVTREEILRQVVRPRSVLGVLPQIIDPEYIYLIVRTRVLYDARATTLRRSELATLVSTAISAYTSESIEKFDSSFRFSKLTRAIDSASPAITSSLTRVEMQRRIFPVLDATNTIIIKFGTAIFKNGTESAILKSTSHRFTYTDTAGVVYASSWFVESDGIVQIHNTETAYKHTFLCTLKNGKIVDSTTFVLSAGEALTEAQITQAILDLYARNPGTIVNTTPTITAIERSVVVRDNVGTFDVTTGTMTLSNFTPSAIEGDEDDIWVTVLPAQTDLFPALNRLFTVDASTIVVEVVDDAAENTTSSFYQGGILR